MKTKYFLLLIILSSSFVDSIAQSYIPFQFGNTRWMYNEQNMFNTKSYCYFSEDTTGYYYNGNKYWLVEKLYAPIYSPTMNGNYVFDDTANRKVYSLDTSTNTQHLLYDFSANVGDTVSSVYNLVGIDTVIVDSIQSKMVNSILRRHFYVHSIYPFVSQTRIWIEGIGSPYDLFYPTILWTDPIYYLVCHEYNSFINYGDLFACANFLTSTGNVERFNDMEIYPNPTTEKITIHNKNSSTRITVTVLDLMGNKLIERESISGVYITTDISSLPKGVYMINIFDNDNSKAFTKSFIKE